MTGIARNVAGLFAFIGLLCGICVAAERPNILWITAEDMSPNLGCYGDLDAMTPRIDALAHGSVRFTHAFATAPVCSPSRSCLITGMYATSLGTQRLRSQFPVPGFVRPFTEYLRKAGYYCTNNVKTDYNLAREAEFIRAAWDESSPRAHWRSRAAGQPFFAVFNFMTTHQSRTSVWPEEQFEHEVRSQLPPASRHDPAKLTLPPFYPDTPEARRAWARYHDCISLLDSQVGEILDQLEADKLAESTIVFCFSDHGMGMPRGKRCLYDSGLRIPLLVRFPSQWSGLAPARSGESSDRLVSFVDFAPTVLSLAGLKSPEHFQGRAFLKPLVAAPSNDAPPNVVFGARDRVDEAFDVARSVRDRRWLYIRNFLPHLPWMQPEGYSDASPFRQELKRLAALGQLSPGLGLYAAPRRPKEELYDTLADPNQLHNLAASPTHAEVLEQMRSRLRRWQLETRDAGFLTEPQIWPQLTGERTPWDIARDDTTYPLAQVLDAASAVGSDDATEAQHRWLGDAHEAIRYWAAAGFAAKARLATEEIDALRSALHDRSPVVRIEAANALARHGETSSALPVLAAALNDDSPEVVLHAARALQLLGPAAQAAQAPMRAALARAREQERAGSDMAMYIRFSLEAASAP
jgi:arylsulfatase A-like enzyme